MTKTRIVYFILIIGPIIDHYRSYINQYIYVMEPDIIRRWQVEASKEMEELQRRLQDLDGKLHQANSLNDLLNSEIAKNQQRIYREKNRLQELELNKTSPVFIEAIRMRMMAEMEGQSFIQDELDVDTMTYEELLQLSQRIGSVSKGLNEKELRLMPTKEYMKAGSDENCMVCFEIIEEKDQIIELPCRHYFHNECGVNWLKVNRCCPLCKSQLPKTSSL